MNQWNFINSKNLQIFWHENNIQFLGKTRLKFLDYICLVFVFKWWQVSRQIMHNDNKKWKLRHKFSFSFRLSKCTKLNTTKRDLNTSWKYQICFEFVVKCKNLKYFGTTKNNNNDKIRFKVLIKSNLYRNKQFEHLQHTRKDYNTIQCIH